MFRYLKLFLACGLVAAATQSGQAFSLLGPTTTENKALAWEVPEIGYNLPGDIGGPVNINEEYRWNVPVVTYGFDQSFLNYFGSSGTNSIISAMTILNNLPKASEMNLNSFPFDSQRFNYQAQALELFNLQTVALNLMLEEMGLTEPERYVFTLRARTTPNSVTTNYYVIQRNFDPVTLGVSSYVNDTLLTYLDIHDDQGGPNPKALPIITTVDPLKKRTSIAGFNMQEGGYYTGLTYDDAGGLKYLFSTNNLNTERILPDIFEVRTNNSVPQHTDTLDLGLLIERSQQTTNDVATLLGFPGYTNLHIISTNSYLTNVVTTNIVSYFTNYPYAFGVPPQAVYVTNYFTNATTAFDYAFDNVVTNSVYTKMVVTQQVDIVPSATVQPGLPNLQTNITYLGTNYVVGGDFYILPVNLITNARGSINLNLGSQIISTQSVTVNMTTNRIFAIQSANVAVTNTNTIPIELDTFDLGQLYVNAHWTTNDPAAVLALYPGIVITETNAHFTNVITTNIASFFTNFPSAPVQVFLTNYVTNVVLVYDYSFGNVVINGASNHFTSFTGWDLNFPDNPPGFANGVDQFPNITWQTASITDVDIEPGTTYQPGQTNGFVTNILDQSTSLIAIPTGDFYLTPSNILGYITNSLVLTGTAFTTNVDFYAESLLLTNEVTSSNLLLVTSDLTTFSETARTNDPAALASLYPGLLITSVSFDFSNAVTTNMSLYLTNYPWDPAGTPQSVATNFVLSTNVVTNFVYTFGNVVTNHYYTSGLVTLISETTTFDPYSPAGSPPNVQTQTVTFSSNYVNGDIYIVPTNFFGYDIVSTLLVDVESVTNILSSTTNQFFTTNLDQTVLIRYTTNYFYLVHPIQILTTNDFGTNTFGRERQTITSVTTNVYDAFPIELVTTNDLVNDPFSSRIEVVTYFTNSTLAYYPIVMRNPGINQALRPGVDKVTFVLMTNNTVVSTNFLPYTNTYVDTFYTNGVVGHQVLRRTSFRPDILFTAADLGQATIGRRTVTDGWDNNNTLNSDDTLAGPGVIPGNSTSGGFAQVVITFNSVGSVTLNTRRPNEEFVNQAYLGELDPANGVTPVTFTWGSFDGSTNPPVVYPLGTPVTTIENKVLTP